MNVQERPIIGDLNRADDGPCSSQRIAVWQLALVLLETLLLARWTWHAAGDPLIDAARDLYAAQRMAHGAVLYADLNYLYGPLPPSLLAWLFRLFGVSANVVRVFDVVTIGLLATMLLDLWNRLADRVTSTVAVGAFLLLCAFAQFTGFRNYSFVLPYTHAATLGFILTLATAWALVRWTQRPTNRWIVFAGMFAGLAVLTKPEMAAAAVITLGGGGLLAALAQGCGGKSIVKFVALSITAFLIGSIVVGWLLCLPASMRQAWHGMTVGYTMAVDPRIRAMKFFADGVGGPYAWRDAKKIAEWLCRYAWVLLPPTLVTLVLPRRRWPVAVLSVIVLTIGVLLPDRVLSARDWNDVFRGVPGLVILMLGVCLAVTWRAKEAADRHQQAARAVVTLSSLTLLIRMFLTARLFQYGFVLMAAALMLLVVAGLNWLPRAVQRIARSGWPIRAVTLGLLIAVTLKFEQFQRVRLSQLNVALPGGFLASGDAGHALNDVVTFLRERSQPSDTLNAAPDGCWLNFELDLPNSTPDELLNPVGIIRSGGDEAVAARLRANPPTWFVLFARPTGVFGPNTFGQDYAQDVAALLRERYRMIQSFGNEPTTPDGKAIWLYRRTD